MELINIFKSSKVRLPLVDLDENNNLKIIKFIDSIKFKNYLDKEL